MEKKKKLKEVVKEVLENYKTARNNNNRLYADVLLTLGYNITELTFNAIMWDNTVPSFESVTRARRRIVREYPSLDADPKIVELRRQEEEIYKGEYGNAD